MKPKLGSGDRFKPVAAKAKYKAVKTVKGKRRGK
jgi:hypothetical protein